MTSINKTQFEQLAMGTVIGALKGLSNSQKSALKYYVNVDSIFNNADKNCNGTLDDNIYSTDIAEQANNEIKIAKSALMEVIQSAILGITSGLFTGALKNAQTPTTYTPPTNTNEATKFEK